MKSWTRDRQVPRVCWTSWTFGIWYAAPPKLRRKTFGIDLGPVALVWRKS